MNQLAVEKLSLKARIQQRFRATPKHEREFLSAALEILDTPPSPAGRATAMLLCSLFVIVLVWAIVGRVDMNATAPAQLVPIGGDKIIQSLEIAQVREILVDNGQQVKAGDLLVVLDSTENTVDLSQLQHQLVHAQHDVARYTAFLSAINGIEPGSDENFEEKLVSSNNSQTQLLAARLLAYRAKIQVLTAQIHESDAMLRSSGHESTRQRGKLTLLNTKAAAFKSMLDHNSVAKFQWLEVEQERTATRDSVAIEQEHANQLRAAKMRLQGELQQYQSDIQHDILSKLVEANEALSKTQLDIERSQERERHRNLRSPVDGTVQDLHIRTVGGVVQPAQPLMTIVPDDAVLAVDAKVLNQDIGFVKAGQRVRLKVDSFPYTKYGVLDGTVMHLSPDAIPDEKLGPVYTARIQLDNHAVTARGNELPIKAGMAVTAEIKTDERRVIDYLLSPIKEVVSEAFKER